MSTKITEIQRFCMHDGPGVRTTVFFKGCPLRCVWCHNPETQKSRTEILFYENKCIGCNSCNAVCKSGAVQSKIDRQKCTACGDCARECPTGALTICGKELSCDEVIALVERDRAFYGELGGVTLSGGEPLAQKDVTELLLALSKRKISIAVESCGYIDERILLEAIPIVDLFLWDIKDTNDARHIKHTGVSNRKILQNLALADKNGAKIRLRCILVNGVNTEREHYESISEIALSLSNCEGVELIPYHAFGGSKAMLIGEPDNGKNEWIPEPWQLDEARAVLRARGVRVVQNGKAD